MKFFRKKKKSRDLSPDEIFLDSQNLPGFDQHQMEGRFEILLGRRVAFSLFAVFILIAGIALVQLWNLQIRQGEEFRTRAFLNRIEQHSLLPERGLITDMYGEEIAWNEPRFQAVLNSSVLTSTRTEIKQLLSVAYPNISLEAFEKKLGDGSSDIVMNDNLSWEEAQSFIRAFPDIPLRIEASPVRKYTSRNGFSHILGYTAYPEKEGESFFLSDMRLGKTGGEKYFDPILRGSKGVRLVELNAEGDVISSSVQKNARNGQSLSLTIDAEMQETVYEILAARIRDYGFEGGAAVVLDTTNGALRAVTSVPEFDINAFTEGLPDEAFRALQENPRAPFFFRAFEGRYVAGSVFKPIVALAALNEGVISPDKEIFSAGSISLPHPYIEDQLSVFKDWKAHGWVDMRRALAVSSNVYFYTIGGGYEQQKGVGAEQIYTYAKQFGFGSPIFEDANEAEGTVPHPEESEFWRVGDTYNFSIGQGGLEVTPLQMARFIAIIARDGRMPPIHLVEEPSSFNDALARIELDDASLPEKHFRVVKEGLRLAVQEGTAQALSGLGVNVAGKTGTAEIGGGKVNSWFIGFFPYENPRLALAIVLERGDEKNLVGAASAAREFVGWLVEEKPEYITLTGT